MKLIIAIIQPYRLEAVKEELYKAEINLITVSEVLGHGRQRAWPRSTAAIRKPETSCGKSAWRPR